MDSDILAAAFKEHRRGVKKEHELINVLREQDGDSDGFPVATANELKKNLEQNVRVLSEMRGKFLYIDPKNYKFWVEIR